MKRSFLATRHLHQGRGAWVHPNSDLGARPGSGRCGGGRDPEIVRDKDRSLRAGAHQRSSTRSFYVHFFVGNIGKLGFRICTGVKPLLQYFA